MSSLSLAIEVGGTFTDWVLADGSRIVRTGKVPSTPGAPALGVLEAARDAATEFADLSAIIHGSTVATNAILERKGARAALVTTKGFRDVLEIQRQSRARLFDLAYRHPEPLVPRKRIIEVDERIGPNGDVWRPLEIGCLTDEIRALMERDAVESIAVCLLHAYANPAHERSVAESLAAAFPASYVTTSSDTLPSFREYERTSTCVISAYVKPSVERYASRLEAFLEEASFRGRFAVVQANGGTVPASEIRRHAARMVLSGPAAGVIGATAAARASGVENLLTFDMGGTSTDVCLITNGVPPMTRDYKIGGLPLSLPMIDITTVGAGGGSIATVDPGGALKVGPESAGADPGPACYDKGGTEFTVTDANVTLGLLRPDTFFGGKMRLSTEAARAALDGLSARLGMRSLDTARGVMRLANATMAQAMRLVSVERGYDPRGYTIVAYGGAGPLHAALLAEELGVDHVLVPYEPGLVSAYGLVLADTRQDFLQTHVASLDALDHETIDLVFGDLRVKAMTEFRSYGLPLESVAVSYFLEMRYFGQAYELSIEVSDILAEKSPVDTIRARFEASHLARYGHATRGNAVEIVHFRLAARCPSAAERLENARIPAGGEVAFEEGTIVMGDEARSCRYYQRGSLPAGFVVAGAAVIEEATATTFVPEGWKGRTDAHGNLLLRREVL